MVQLAEFILHPADFMFADFISSVREIKDEPLVMPILDLSNCIPYLALKLFIYLKTLAMKKLIMLFVVVCCSVNLMAHTGIEINEKVEASFKATFPDAKDVKWHDNGDTYLARFFRNGIDTRIQYDKEGAILKTTRYYDQKDLPAFLLSKLNKKFSDKKIHLVTEITSEEGLEYHISLHDQKKWYMVKASPNGSLQVYDKYNKQ